MSPTITIFPLKTKEDILQDINEFCSQVCLLLSIERRKRSYLNERDTDPHLASKMSTLVCAVSIYSSQIRSNFEKCLLKSANQGK